MVILTTNEYIVKSKEFGLKMKKRHIESFKLKSLKMYLNHQTIIHFFKCYFLISGFLIQLNISGTFHKNHRRGFPAVIFVREKVINCDKTNNDT